MSMIIGLLGFAGVMFVIWLFVVMLVRGIARVEQRPPAEQLAARFAKGEITEGEYLRNLAILQHGDDLVLEADRDELRLPRETGSGDP